MTITPNTPTDDRAEQGTMNEARIREAFAELNRVLAEEGSIYGVNGVFARDTLIRAQVIHLPAEESVEIEKTYTSSSTANKQYGHYN